MSLIDKLTGRAKQAAGDVTGDTLSALIGAPQEELHFELADAVAVNDARGVFEVINGVVQGGHDLRHVTGQILVPVLVAKEEGILDQAIYDGVVETREPSPGRVLVAAE